MTAPLPPPDSLDELSARIDLVELRVVRRDLEFREHWHSLQHRGQAVLSPARWLLPLVGGGSGWLFWKLFRRKSRRDAHGAPPRRHAARSQAAPAPEGDTKPEVKLLQTLTLLWGLAPAAWRGRLGPETTQLLLGLLAGLLHSRRKQAPADDAQKQGDRR